MSTTTTPLYMQERGILADSTMYNVLVLCCTWLGFILSYTAKNRQVMGPRRMPCGTSVAYGTINMDYLARLPITSQLLIKRPDLEPISLLDRRRHFPHLCEDGCALEKSHLQYKSLAPSRNLTLLLSSADAK